MIRPTSPSMGIAPHSSGKCPGKIASSAGTNMSSQIPPRVFAIGVCTGGSKPTRAEHTEEDGQQKRSDAQECRMTSERYAPKMPIQLRAACDPVRMDALLSEGSSGEYEANARKRRSAETHNRNPTSSFRRRFLVGEKAFERCHVQRQRWATAYPERRIRPEPNNYDKKQRFAQTWQKGWLASLDTRRRRAGFTLFDPRSLL